MTSVGIAVAVRDAAQRVADDFTARTAVSVDATTILTGRAALLGLAPGGRVSAGGATRLMPGRDGWFAATLSRADDVALLPALLGCDDEPAEPWQALARWVARRPAAEATERARLLGLPAATLAETPPSPPAVRSLGRRTAPRSLPGLLVADLSSMWAGPLCGQLLRHAGATVVKVETRARPDGTRAGPASFFDWMNSGKLCYEVDLDNPAGLHALLSVADVVIEGSRPTALQRRRLGPHDVPGPGGRVWIRVTGHGTAGACADRVAFGDDAAVSGGLVRRGPSFIGDAIADPLTGLAAAAAVAKSLARGGGELIDVAMATVAATYATDVGEQHCLATATAPESSPAAGRLGGDTAMVDRLVAEREVMTC